MFDEMHADKTRPSTGDDPFAQLRNFVEDYREPLLNAAELLAGRSGLHLVHAIADQLADRRRVTRHTLALLHRLRELLDLENVHDEWRDEAGYFAALHPADPAVEELCLLADLYRDALDQAGLDHLPASRLAAA